MDKVEILIVDDEAINLSVLRKLLTPEFTVRACKSGEEAMRLIIIDNADDSRDLMTAALGDSGRLLERQIQDFD